MNGRQITLLLTVLTLLNPVGGGIIHRLQHRANFYDNVFLREESSQMVILVAVLVCANVRRRWKERGNCFERPLMSLPLQRLSLSMLFKASGAGERGRVCKQRVTHSEALSLSSRGLYGLRDDQDTPTPPSIPPWFYTGPERTAEGTDI